MGYTDLIEDKNAAARKKDIEDIERLKKTGKVNNFTPEFPSAIVVHLTMDRFFH